ncbi:MAG: hypothetical protein CVV22_03740 [Ignavibacteriae bacterium HGW-Ignavibacteriae-1]|nr:MAG: hypothetical protein CVV22_03740 [Ignavibacteriae bacterium HGW-Ignavibacteriae-1]
MTKRGLHEGIDFYFDTTGLIVFIEKYLLERGSCCKCGCRHCPYNPKGTAKNSKDNPKNQSLLR